MDEYIGILSIIYIIAIVIRLKDTQKSFERYREEFKEVRSKLEIASRQKNPFIIMKFTNFVFYSLLVLYYIANLILFDSYLLITIFSYLLILVVVFKLGRKLRVSSLADFEQIAKESQQEYDKKQKFSFYLGLVEFAYAFNALSLISFYH